MVSAGYQGKVETVRTNREYFILLSSVNYILEPANGDLFIRYRETLDSHLVQPSMSNIKSKNSRFQKQEFGDSFAVSAILTCQILESPTDKKCVAMAERDYIS